MNLASGDFIARLAFQNSGFLLVAVVDSRLDSFARIVSVNKRMPRRDWVWRSEMLDVNAVWVVTVVFSQMFWVCFED